MAAIDGLPVSGYRPQSADAIAMVNTNKEIEERLLRILDEMAEDPAIDRRWLAIGRTSIEQGFMAVNRSIFRPERVALPDEDDPIVETGWVIERADSPVSAPLYYAPRYGDSEHVDAQDWCGRHEDALRFARSEDAALFATARLGEANVRVCEHQWG